MYINNCTSLSQIYNTAISHTHRAPPPPQKKRKKICISKVLSLSRGFYRNYYLFFLSQIPASQLWWWEYCLKTKWKNWLFEAVYRHTQKMYTQGWELAALYIASWELNSVSRLYREKFCHVSSKHTHHRSLWRRCKGWAFACNCLSPQQMMQKQLL